MTNKQIAIIAIVALVAFWISLVVGGEYEGGFVGFVYYGSLLCFYVFTVWGWIRLMK